MEKTLPQYKPTNTHPSSEWSHCCNTSNSRWFGPHWPFFRACAVTEKNHYLQYWAELS